MEDDLKKNEMEDNLKKWKNGRRPQVQFKKNLIGFDIIVN